MVICEECAFSNWDFSLFPQDIYRGRFGEIVIPEQFDFYCSLHERFYLESEMGTCKEGALGDNNYSEICKEYYKQKKYIMERLKIERKVNEILIEQLGIPEGLIKGDSHFEKDLGGDSLDCVDTLLKIEDTFGITIPDAETTHCKTVKDIYDLVEKHCK